MYKMPWWGDTLELDDSQNGIQSDHVEEHVMKGYLSDRDTFSEILSSNPE